MIRIYCLLLFLCHHISKAQPLSVGDKLSPTAVAGFQPALLHKVPASVPSKRFTILNFLATYCSGCIAALPQMDSLQKQYSQQLDVLLISNEPQSKLQSWAKARKLNLPFIADASKLKAIFPHEFISHLVWINPSGKIVAITGKEYFTEKNIKLALSDAVLNWPVKKDYDLSAKKAALLDGERNPLFLLQSGSGGHYQAAFSHQLDLPTSFSVTVDSIAGKSTLRLINKPLLYWYGIALDAKNWPLSQIIMHDTITDAWFFNPSLHYSAAWNRAFHFSYESVAPLQFTKKQHAQQLLSFANELFGVQAQKKDTMVKAWVLEQSGTGKGSTKGTSNNIDILSVVLTLNNRPGLPPVVDGRLHKTPFLLPQPAQFPQTLQALNEWVTTYGLCFTEARVMVPMLIFSRTAPQPFLTPAKNYTK